MNTQSTALPDSPLDSKPIAGAGIGTQRAVLWSVRREIWENRSLYTAPLIVAAVILVGSLIAGIRMQDKLRALIATGPIEHGHGIGKPLGMIAAAIVATAFVVGVFY